VGWPELKEEVPLHRRAKRRGKKVKRGKRGKKEKGRSKPKVLVRMRKRETQQRRIRGKILTITG